MNFNTNNDYFPSLKTIADVLPGNYEMRDHSELYNEPQFFPQDYVDFDYDLTQFRVTKFGYAGSNCTIQREMMPNSRSSSWQYAGGGTILYVQSANLTSFEMDTTGCQTFPQALNGVYPLLTGGLLTTQGQCWVIDYVQQGGNRQYVFFVPKNAVCNIESATNVQVLQVGNFIYSNIGSFEIDAITDGIAGGYITLWDGSYRYGKVSYMVQQDIYEYDSTPNWTAKNAYDQVSYLCPLSPTMVGVPYSSRTGELGLGESLNNYLFGGIIYGLRYSMFWNAEGKTPYQYRAIQLQFSGKLFTPTLCSANDTLQSDYLTLNVT